MVETFNNFETVLAGTNCNRRVKWLEWFITEHAWEGICRNREPSSAIH
mgnify:CR=1 FL=1